MGDLISREALIEVLLNLRPEGFEKSFAGKIALRKIAESPAVDAVEVVRCKNCEFATDIGTDYLICGGWGFRTDHNGFCYRGAKMEGNK